MKGETYRKIVDTVRGRRGLSICVVWANRILTRLSYIVYPLFLLILSLRKEPELVKAILVPAVSFVLLSVFRYLYNAPRPYEALELTPLINKGTKGKSFPSRHVFSAFVIATVICYFYPAAGLVLEVCAALLALCRVVSGVHFIRDVAVGAACGVGSGLIGCWML